MILWEILYNCGQLKSFKRWFYVHMIAINLPFIAAQTKQFRLEQTIEKILMLVPVG